MLTNENQNTEYGHYLIIKDLNVAAWCLQFTEKVADHDIIHTSDELDIFCIGLMVVAWSLWYTSHEY